MPKTVTLKQVQETWHSATMPDLPDDQLEQNDQQLRSLIHPASAHRIDIYHELLNGVIEECLSSIFPYTQKLIAPLSDWSYWSERYRRAYPNPSYLLLPAVADFPEFIGKVIFTEEPELQTAYPYLSELACYEWLDVSVANASDKPINPALKAFVPETEESCMQYKPVWNHTATLFSASYPIPGIIDRLETIDDSDTLPEALNTIQAALSHFMIYRDPATEKSRYFSLTPLTAALIAFTQRHPSYQQAIQQLHAACTVNTAQQIPDYKQFSASALSFLQTAFSHNLLTGSLPVEVK